MDERNRCDHCKKTPKDLMKCGRCKQVFYCDRDCQKAQWSTHKQVCRPSDDAAAAIQENKTQQGSQNIKNNINKNTREECDKSDVDEEEEDEYDDEDNLYDTRPDWTGKCMVCGMSPILPVTSMCGPCTFGEADTIYGNW
jgi:hypothetical protein